MATLRVEGRTTYETAGTILGRGPIGAERTNQSAGAVHRIDQNGGALVRRAGVIGWAAIGTAGYDRAACSLRRTLSCVRTMAAMRIDRRRPLLGPARRARPG